MFPVPSTQEVGLVWLERMRWGTVASALAVLVVARFALGLALPFALLLGLLVASAATNAAFSAFLRRRAPHPWLPFAVLAFDVAMLTIGLRLSGGASNPFSALYVVYVTLGAVLLGARATWALVLLATLGFALLFVGLAPDAHGMHAMHGMHQMPDGTWMANGPGMGGDAQAIDPFLSHLYGMLAAFAVSAVLIAFFVTRLVSALRAREDELARAREHGERIERLASLTTLAAGAAHELGTPLGTIAITAKELERALRAGDRGALADEAALVRDEARRCRAILDGMAARAGESVGEAPVLVDAADVARDVVAAARRDGGLVLDLEVAQATVRVPVRAFTSALENLVRNARDAGAGRVTVRVARAPGEVAVHVEDDGPGMDAGTLARAVEPFFTTKDEGRGMGLGLFLVATVVERLGGRFDLRSEKGAGTRAVIHLPEARSA